MRVRGGGGGGEGSLQLATDRESWYLLGCLKVFWATKSKLVSVRKSF